MVSGTDTYSDIDNLLNNLHYWYDAVNICLGASYMPCWADYAEYLNEFTYISKRAYFTLKGYSKTRNWYRTIHKVRKLLRSNRTFYIKTKRRKK